MGSVKASPPGARATVSEVDELCVTLDQVIRKRAKTHVNKPVISYPVHETDFVDYTGADLERVTRHAAHEYAEALARDLVIESNESLRKPPVGPSIVALVGISSLEYYITFLALQRLGISTMFISPRLADQGYTHLLNKMDCSVAVASGPSFDTLQHVRQTYSLANGLSIIPMIDYAFLQACLRRDAGTGNGQTQEAPDLTPVNDGDCQYFIIHSGGSTGLPKPVPTTASAWLLQAADIVGRIPRADTLSSLPLFHSFGLATLLRGLVNGTRLSLVNAARPITADIIRKGLDITKSQALVTVPYILKFFAEVDGPGGVHRLGQLKQVIAAGSAIPDELGDKLVAAGANIFHLYGQTESGALMEPARDRLLWSWVTPLPHAASYLRFEPIGDDSQNLYHLIVLDGLKQKVFSSRPDGSYETKDLFQRHPTELNLWKFVARKDDIIVLINGEKADPIPVEDALTANPNVKAAVAFGQSRDSVGLVVVRSERSSSLSREEFIEAILPDLELGNSRVPAYARVSKEMIVVKDADTQYPVTDKSTVIRSLFLKAFREDIDEIYSSKVKHVSKTQERGPLSATQVRKMISRAVREELRLESARGSNGDHKNGKQHELTDDSDFFDLGMDSLQATNIRSRLLSEIDLGGRALATNVVFDHPNIQSLSRHLLQVRGGHLEQTTKQTTEELARAMVDKYSDFSPIQPGIKSVSSDMQHVLLTGATGQVGTHILSQLLQRHDVGTVLCLVRATDEQSALSRVHSALRASHLLDELSSSHVRKIEALPCDLADPSGSLGLTPTAVETIRGSVTSMIHNAWSVNFNMSLESFESQSIRPTFHLINLALSSTLHKKPTFTLVSSIASVLHARTWSGKISEDRHGWASVAPMGYGQSKWVAEEICAAAADKTCLRTRVIRLGQVAGDTKHGIWKAAEAIPTTVHSALTVGALPLIEPGPSGQVCDEFHWIPADTTAAAVVELALLDETPGPRLEGGNVAQVSMFHVTNPSPIKWNTEFLPAIKQALQQRGVAFEALPQREWLRRLEGSDSNAARNPPMKLLDFFRMRYGSVMTAQEPVLDITRTSQFASSLRKKEEMTLDSWLVGKFIKYWMEECWAVVPK